MGLDPESARFLGDMDERAKGFDPEISRLVDELRFQQLGKPIVYIAAPPSENYQKQIASSLATLAGNAQTPLESAPESAEEELIGYILPAQSDQNRHLVIFKDGTMLVTEPVDTGKIDQYRHYFAVSENPFTVDRGTSIPKVVASLSFVPPTGNKVLYRNDNPSDVPQIDAAREQAIQLAQGLKEQRVKAKGDTSRRLVDGLKNLLFPPKPPQPDQPQ